MEIYVIFGLPGAGKTYVGKTLQRHFGFHLYDGDQDMQQELKDAIAKQTTITDQMRDDFFNKLFTNTKRLKTKYDKIVVCQTFIKEKYRELFLDKIPETKFILVQADTNIRENRLIKRKGFQLELKYWRKMSAIFDPPEIKYSIIDNNSDGKESVKRQLQLLLK